MGKIEAKLHAMGLVLPAPPVLPPNIVLPFAAVRLHDGRGFVSGHGALNADGSFANPRGAVGGELTEAEGVIAARLTALAMLASLKRALGDLDRVTAWLRVFGMVRAAPGFDRYPAVINGCSDLLVEVLGEAGQHARSAIGMGSLPNRMTVEIEAIFHLD